VEFTGFTAEAEDKKITLNWVTASETNNRGFEIQRSVDATTWTAVGFVDGTGNSANPRQYSFVDDHLAPARYYYRLKQQDFSAYFKYSSIVSATVLGDVFVLEQNQPNPFSSTTNIRFTLAEKTKVRLTLVDVQGRLVRTILDETKEAGTHVVKLNAHSLAKGLYYYKLEAKGFSGVKKMLVK
jgi:hypothetical protein